MRVAGEGLKKKESRKASPKGGRPSDTEKWTCDVR